MIEVTGVSFDGNKIYYFDSNGFKIKKNVTVIVETEQGQQFGTVQIPSKQIDQKNLKE